MMPFIVMLGVPKLSRLVGLTTMPNPASSGEEDCKLRPGHKVDGRWQVVRKLGQGSFGAVYEAIDALEKIKGTKALKLESVQARDQVLKIEVAVLSGLSASKHACRMYACGKNDRFNFLLMTLLGPSITVLRRKKENNRFGLVSSAYVSIQCLQALRDMHRAGWLHRDVKPSNFAVGNTNEDIRRTIFVFDFGLARYYLKAGGKIRESRDNVGFRGTLRYCSVNGHRGTELGRQDDVISILYMLVEMVKGNLPWKNLDTNREVLLSKDANAYRLYDLMPPKLVEVHDYLHSLRYEDMPNYNMLDDVLMDIILGRAYAKETSIKWTDSSLMEQAASKSRESKEAVFGSHVEQTDPNNNPARVANLPKSEFKEPFFK